MEAFQLNFRITMGLFAAVALLLQTGCAEETNIDQYSLGSTSAPPPPPEPLPVLTVNSAPADLHLDPTVAFGFSASDPGGGAIARFECSLDDGPWELCVNPKEYRNTADGAHKFQMKAVNTKEISSTVYVKNWVQGTPVPIYQLYSALAKDHLYSQDPAEGTTFSYINQGLVFYLLQNAVPGTKPLYRCRINNLPYHFVSSSADCESPTHTNEGILGHALVTATPNFEKLYRVVFATDHALSLGIPVNPGLFAIEVEVDLGYALIP